MAARGARTGKKLPPVRFFPVISCRLDAPA
jgi:hypothetical protein